MGSVPWRRREPIRFRIDRRRGEPARRRQLRRRLIAYLVALAVLFVTALVQVVWEAAHLRQGLQEIALNVGVEVLGATALAGLPLWTGTWFRSDRILIVLATALVAFGAWQGLPDSIDDTTGTAIVAWVRALGSIPIIALNLWLVSPAPERRAS